MLEALETGGRNLDVIDVGDEVVGGEVAASVGLHRGRCALRNIGDGDGGVRDDRAGGVCNGSVDGSIDRLPKAAGASASRQTSQESQIYSRPLHSNALQKLSRIRIFLLRHGRIGSTSADWAACACLSQPLLETRGMFFVSYAAEDTPGPNKLSIHLHVIL